jgi:choline dehydrogenase-like flavoprotein
VFVVATGGIENARLLLLSNRFNRRGLGNQHDLVGRYFMDHPIVSWGEAGIIAPSGFPLPFYDENAEVGIVHAGATQKATLWGFITPTEDLLRHEKLLNCGIAVRPIGLPDATGVVSARQIRGAITSGKWPENFGEHIGNVISDIDDITFLACQKLTGNETPTMLEMLYWAEPCPNPDSRVRLSTERDALGQQQVALDWQLTDLDKHNMRRILQILATELGASGLGRLGVNPTVWSDDWGSLLKGSYHHMGTTRMHKDPKQGVTDPDCRVHGVSNVYIAGSSLFPNSGHANPTITIVALALRLADHIKQKMR